MNKQIKHVRRHVVSAKQLEWGRWHVELECGHEQTYTRFVYFGKLAGRPPVKIICNRCSVPRCLGVGVLAVLEGEIDMKHPMAAAALLDLQDKLIAQTVEVKLTTP